jgi:hypothetical protein
VFATHLLCLSGCLAIVPVRSGLAAKLGGIPNIKKAEIFFHSINFSATYATIASSINLKASARIKFYRFRPITHGAAPLGASNSEGPRVPRNGKIKWLVDLWRRLLFFSAGPAAIVLVDARENDQHSARPPVELDFDLDF